MAIVFFVCFLENRFFFNRVLDILAWKSGPKKGV